METQIIFSYCLADSIVKALKLKEDPQSKMCLGEIITNVMIKGLRENILSMINLKPSITRNKIETVFSGITALMPRTIRAKTEKGFCLKVMFFILAYTIKLSLAK